MQSGASLRHGRISKSGDKLGRAILIEIVHLGTMRAGWIRDTFVHYLRGDPNRRNTAVVATARRLLVILWAKMRDHRRENPGLPLFRDVTAGADTRVDVATA